MASVHILGIESSCDETSASVCVDGRILSNIIATQELHRAYGGVVPELASRAHIQHIVPVVDAALQQARITMKELNGIAFTQAPGLIGALLVGAGFAKSLSLALDIPLVGVHHMQAHVLANLIEDPAPRFPFLCLTVSGGHTQIVVCRSPLDMEILGETIDDAAGEAFDKSAKMLGLPYPGGPLIDKHAASGDPHRFQFAEPTIPGLNFSFSGVKTSILYFLQNATRKEPDFIRQNLADLCASIQHRIVEILLKKLRLAALETGIREVCLSGGVSANRGLRDAFMALGEKQGWKTYVPRFEYCTDNAAMIAITGYHRFQAGRFEELDTQSSARGHWSSEG
jgi:N6-L-threonylcarbamoyladenine synthase